MNGVKDAVTNVVRLVVIERALKWSDDDADEHVFLTFSHAETLNCDSGQRRVRRLGENCDFLDDVGVIAEFVAYSVAYVLRRIMLVHGDGEVPSYGWKLRHGTVGRQVDHL